MNLTLRHFHANTGGQLVLPIFDGLIVAAPIGAEDRVHAALQDAADSAVLAGGIPQLKAVVTGR